MTTARDRRPDQHADHARGIDAAPLPGIETAPRIPYRLAFAGALAIAICAAAVLTHREAIERALGEPVSAIAAPCRLKRDGQVAHITVRLHAGELIAQCAIFEGRKK